MKLTRLSSTCFRSRQTLALSRSRNETKGTDTSQISADMPLPSNEQRHDCAEKLHKRILQEPLPEVAAVTEIEAMHAVDLPQHSPRAVAGQKWRLLRTKTESINGFLLPERSARRCLRRRQCVFCSAISLISFRARPPGARNDEQNNQSAFTYSFAMIASASKPLSAKPCACSHLIWLSTFFTSSLPSGSI